MSEIRLLNEGDRAQIIELSKYWLTDMGVALSESDKARQIDELDNYLDTDNHAWLMVGDIEGTQLNAYLQFFIWNLFPHATLMNIRKIKENEESLNSTIAHLKKYMLHHLLENQIKTFFTVRPMSRDKSYDNYYNRYLEEFQSWSKCQVTVVPKNTKPKYEYQWRMLESKTWPIDLVINSYHHKDKD